ncbi:MAG: hypothetical protein V4736_05075 [Bdellovibrionota bacterium]
MNLRVKKPVYALMAVFLITSITVSHSQAAMCVGALKEPTEVDRGYEALVNEFAAAWKQQQSNALSLELDPILKDPSEGPEKKKVLQKLGFTFKDGVMAGPELRKLIENYNTYLNELGIPVKERILPAITLVRDTPTGKEFQYVALGVDPWPKEAGYRIYRFGVDAFNIPIKDMMKAHRAGRFPILAYHDVSHFASFAKNTGYMRAVRKTMGALPKVPKGSSFYSRLFMMIEALSLGNPKKIEVMKKTFLTPAIKNGPGWLRLQEFQSHYASLKEEKIVKQTKLMAEKFDSLVIDFGAANFRSYERDNAFSSSAYTYGGKINIAESHVIRFLMAEPGVGFQPMILRSNFAGISGWNLGGLVKAYEKLATDPNALDEQIGTALGNPSWKLEGGPHTTGKEVVLQLMREELSKAEFLLWNSSQIPVSEWVSTVLSAEAMNLNSKPAVILRDVIGANSQLYKKMTNDYNLNADQQ